MQPVEIDDAGVIRFKSNAIVRELLEFAEARGLNMNVIARGGFSEEDRAQFAQLIGYSVSGFGDLSYVPRELVRRADRAAEKLREEERDA